MFMCEISITIILICQKLGSVGPIQQKVKLPSPKVFIIQIILPENSKQNRYCRIKEIRV